MSGSSRTSTSLRMPGVEQVRFSTCLKFKSARACSQLRVASIAGPPPALQPAVRSATIASPSARRTTIVCFTMLDLFSVLVRWAHQPRAVLFDHVNLLIDRLTLLELSDDRS